MLNKVTINVLVAILFYSNLIQNIIPVAVGQVFLQELKIILKRKGIYLMV